MDQEWLNLFLGFLVGIPLGTVSGVYWLRWMMRVRAEELSKENRDWLGYHAP